MTVLRALVVCVVVAIGQPAVAAARPRAQARAVDQSVHARQAYDAGQFERAANLYRLAYQLDPAEPTYLYGVGKSEQMAGRCGVADGAFAELKARLPGDHPILARVAAAELLCHPPAAPVVAPVPAPVAVAVAAPLASPVSVVVLPVAPTPAALPGDVAGERLVPTLAAPLAPTEPPPRRSVSQAWTFWAGLGVGVAASVTGAWAGWATADLDSQTGHLAPTDARDRQQTINNASTAAAVLGGLAVAGIGHGLWSTWRGADRD